MLRDAQPATRPRARLELPVTEAAMAAALRPFASLPPEIAQLPRWCRWTLQKNANGKPTKVPDCSTRDRTKWRTVEDVTAEPIDPATGAGLVMTGGVQLPDATWLVALDVDGCRSPGTGRLEPWAVQLLEMHGNSYSEVTPSGMGIRIFIATRTLPELGRAKAVLPYQRPAGVPDSKAVEVQVFGSGPAGYVTVTGDHLPGTRTTIERVDNLSALVEHLKLDPAGSTMGRVELPEGPGDPPDPEVITQRVRATPWGEAFIRAEWSRLVHEGGDQSASAAFNFGLKQLLPLCLDHGQAVVDWIRHETAWGSGQVHDSADPSRYMREDWLRAEVARTHAKRGVAAVGDVFEAFAADPTNTAPELLPTDEQPGWLVSGAEFIKQRAKNRFLVYQLMPRTGLVQIHGKPGCGKTPFALSLAVAVASGSEEWFGHTIDHAGPVVYMIGEDEQGMRDRFRAELTQHKLAPSQCDIHFSNRPGRLTDQQDAIRWMEEVRRVYPKPEGIALLVIDTQAANFGSGDENSTEDMLKFLANLGGLSRALRCLVLLVHHEGVAGGKRGRGSSAVDGAVDGRWHIDRPTKLGVVAESMKEKNWAKPDDLEGSLAVHVVDVDERGRDQTAVALSFEPESAADVFAQVGEADPLMTLLGRLHEAGGALDKTALAAGVGMKKDSRRFRDLTARGVTMRLIEQEKTGRTTSFRLTPEGVDLHAFGAAHASEAGLDDMLADLFDE